MGWIRRCRFGVRAPAWLLYSSALLSAVPLHAAAANDAPALAAAPARKAFASAKLMFDIPAGPLEGALQQWAEVSQLRLLVPSEHIQDLHAAGVSGAFTPEEALKRLLMATRLKYELTGARSVAVYDPASAMGAKAQGVAELPKITVRRGQRKPAPRPAPLPAPVPPPVNPNSTIVPPPAYAGGQVATGGQLGLLGNRTFMDTPFNQTSYTSELIKNQQARTISDVLANDPSVRNEFPGGSGIDQFTIRGFLAGNQDIAFNGLYGIAPTSNGMMAAESIERVEVLKGPNALLNGMAPFGSIGGLINIVPKRAGALPLTEFTPSYYSDSQFGGHFDVGRRVETGAGSVGVRFNGVYRDGDTAIDRQSQETRVSALGLDFQGERVRLSGDLGYQFIDTDVTRRPLRVNAGVPLPEAPKSRSNYSQPWTFQQNENIYGVLRSELDITPEWTAFVAVGSGRLHHKNLSENQVVTNAQGATTNNPAAVRIREDTLTAEAGVRGNIQAGFVHHDLSLTSTVFDKETGSAFVQAAAVSSNIYNPIFAAEPTFAGVPSVGDAPKTGDQRLSSLAFADTLSVLDKRIQLTLGLRHQTVRAANFNGGMRTSSYDESALTPAVGLVVKPVENLSLYGSYIEGLAPGPVASPGLANAGEIFPPFVTKQYEAGMKLDFGRLATTLSVFQISQPSSFVLNNRLMVDGEQQNRGVELITFGEVTKNIRVLGGVTFLNSELTKTAGGVNQGNEGIGTPSVQANLGGEWDTPFLRGLTLMARGIYTSSQYLDAANTQELPSWTRLDLGARYVIERNGKPIIVRANVENVFDADYWASASRGLLGLSTPRTFLVSTTFSF